MIAAPSLGILFFIPVPLVIRRRARVSFKWITYFEEVEFFEIRVGGVNHPDIVLAQKGDQMGIGDEISADREFSGNFSVNFQEAVHLSQNLHPWQIQKCFQVAQCFIGGERR